MITHAAHEGKGLLEIGLVQVIEKEATDAARLITVFQVKILVAPLLVLVVTIRAEGVAGLFGNAMPVLTVGLESVVRGQVESTAEPPDRILAVFFGDEKAHIGVRGRNIGIVGMDHQRYAHGAEASARELGAVGACRRRQAVAMDFGKVDPGLLEYRAIAQYHAAATTAGRALPAVGDERGLAVDGL
jgi:hypothetical protein